MMRTMRLGEVFLELFEHNTHDAIIFLPSDHEGAEGEQRGSVAAG